MDEIKNITELSKRMMNPLDNDELYYKAFDISYKGASRKFSQCFDYDLNSENKDTKTYPAKAIYSLMKLRVGIIKNNIENMDENEFQKYLTAKLNNNAPSKQKEPYIKYFERLQNLQFDEWVEKIKKEEKTYFSVYKALVEPGPVNKLGFSYIRSYQIAPNRQEQIHSNDVKHRLYITMDYSQLYKFVIKLVKTLEVNNMPYSMKVETNMKMKHNDVLVIYIDNEKRLLKTINVINGLLDRNPEFQEKLHTPSEHLYSIDDRIGYGFEPSSKDSYSNEMGYNLEESTDEACKQIVDSLISDKRDKTYYGYKADFIEAAKNNNYSGIIQTKLNKERMIGKHKYLINTLKRLVRPKLEEKIRNKLGIDLNNVFNVEKNIQELGNESELEDTIYMDETETTINEMQDEIENSQNK